MMVVVLAAKRAARGSDYAHSTDHLPQRLYGNLVVNKTAEGDQVDGPYIVDATLLRESLHAGPRPHVPTL